MGKTGHSDPNFYGGFENYDSDGNKTGHTEPGFFGNYTSYDSSGNKAGHSEPNFFGGYDHYDSNGHKVGHSDPDFFGGYTHYDASGNKTGHSNPDFWGGYSHDDDDACYVATAVYGSYDCPEVWTLRRFRDQTLKASRLGRLFIKAYYRTSPALVRQFGGCERICRWCRSRLDSLVRCLQKRGYESGPYEDMTAKRK